MFEYLDHLYDSATKIGSAIIVINTCILIMYLLFRLEKFIGMMMQKDTQDSVVIDNKEIHININNRRYEIQFDKFKKLFWWAIVITYVIGIVTCYSIVFFPLLLLIVGLWIYRLIKAGPIKGIKSVLKIASPK